MSEVVTAAGNEVSVVETATEVVVQEVQTTVDVQDGVVVEVTASQGVIVELPSAAAEVVVNTDPLEILEVAQQGPAGPPGASGGGGAGGSDANLYFTQNSPSALWTIIHSLGKYPSVTLLDTTHRQIFGTVTYPTPTQVNVHFSTPQMGTATLN